MYEGVLWRGMAGAPELITYMFTRFSNLKSTDCPELVVGLHAYIALLRQDTGIGSPGLYPLASSKLFNGSCPLKAVARQLQNESETASGSHILIKQSYGRVLGREGSKKAGTRVKTSV